jgi:hypothetical protein
VVRVNTGGRRSPLGPLLRGLACCALFITLLGLGAGSVVARPLVVNSSVTTMSRAVAAVLPFARAATPDQNALPSAAAVLPVALGLVLVRFRRVVLHLGRLVRRPLGRAPPGLTEHH